MWYRRYKNNFSKEAMDKKVMRIVGASGIEWRGYTKDQLITKTDPDVEVTSRFVVQQERIKERVSLTEYLGLVLQEPATDRKYALEKLGKAYGLKSDELERLSPPSIDEIVALQENESLNNDSFDDPYPVLVKKDQDHNVHLRIHDRVKENDKKPAHQKAHEEALLLKQSNPDFFQPDPLEAEFDAENQLPTPTPKTDIKSVLP